MNWETFFTEKRKVQIPVAKKMKRLSVTIIFQIIFFFPKISNFKFSCFSKKQQFGELFQKRFTTGIRDFRGWGHV